jgi:hypothetical protein
MTYLVTGSSGHLGERKLAGRVDAVLSPVMSPTEAGIWSVGTMPFLPLHFYKKEDNFLPTCRSGSGTVNPRRSSCSLDS